MALFVNQENTRTKLQQKIAADLAEKAKKKVTEAAGQPDGVEDSAYMENTKQTTPLAWLWAIVAVVVVAIVLWLVVGTR